MSPRRIEILWAKVRLPVMTMGFRARSRQICHRFRGRVRVRLLGQLSLVTRSILFAALSYIP